MGRCKITMKKILKILVFAAVTFLIILVGKPGIEDFWARFMGFVAPHGEYTEHMIKKWSNKSTDFLISRLNHPSIEYSGVATSILAGRKDLSREDKLLDIVHNSKEYRSRYLALSILFVWDEPKATNMSMEILKAGRSHPLYGDALLHLSKRKHEPAYRYAVDLARAPDKYNNGSVAYLADFGKMESLPILEEMFQGTSDGLYRRMITSAVQSIKEKNGIKS